MPERIPGGHLGLGNNRDLSFLEIARGAGLEIGSESDLEVADDVCRGELTETRSGEETGEFGSAHLQHWAQLVWVRRVASSKEQMRQELLSWVLLTFLLIAGWLGCYRGPLQGPRQNLVPASASPRTRVERPCAPEFSFHWPCQDGSTETTATKVFVLPYMKIN